jgi:hypothetical protein
MDMRIGLLGLLAEARTSIKISGEYCPAAGFVTRKLNTYAVFGIKDSTIHKIKLALVLFQEPYPTVPPQLSEKREAWAEESCRAPDAV